MRGIRGVSALGCLLALAGCGSPTASSTTTTSVTATTTTTSVPNTSASSHYSGTVTPPGGTPSPIDLSLFFNLPGAASFGHQALRPLAIFNVTGGFNTNGPGGTGGFSASVEGTLDGTPLDGGTFTGVLSTRLSNGCVAKRNYAGPLSTGSVDWTPGAQIDACGGASPLTFSIAVRSIPTPPTTTVPSTTSTTPGQSNLTFAFSQPGPGRRNITCTGASAPNTSLTWLYTLTIRNPGNVPFTISSWTTSLSQGISQNAVAFDRAFGVSTIPAGGSATANLCAFTSGPDTASGSLSHTFTGTGGNGPFTTPSLTLPPP